MRTFTRQEICERLRTKIGKREALLFGSAGIGLTAKMQERAGIDLILTYCACAYRMDAIPTATSLLAYADCNEVTMELGRRILTIVQNTPVIAGIGAADPYRDHAKLIDNLIERGFSGIINAPSIGEYDSLFRSESDNSQIGYPQEIALISTCRKKDVFSIAFAFSPDDASAMAGAGADVVCAHIGPSTQEAMSIDEASALLGAMREAVRKENADTLVIGHGGPLVTPEAVRQCLLNADLHGFLGSSVFETAPIRAGVSQIVKEFEMLRPR